MTHVCTCGDCESEPFSDSCKFELELKRLREAICAHHDERYGPRQPMFAIDRRLYEAAGLKTKS